MKRPVILFGDPILRTRPQVVSIFDGILAHQIDAMRETMLDEGGVGLAANQVGYFRRLFVWQALGQSGAICNPEIIDRSEEVEDKVEGCLSIPNFAASVFRAREVLISGVAPTGERVEIEAEGLIARIFQHEIDHLDGKLFVDRTVGLERAKTFEALRNGDAWQMVAEMAR